MLYPNFPGPTQSTPKKVTFQVPESTTATSPPISKLQRRKMAKQLVALARSERGQCL